MRLPRNLKIFRGQLDVAPFAGVTFLLLLFIALQSKLVFTPGIVLDLPRVTRDLPGTPDATVVVAVDQGGTIYYQNQAVPTLQQLRLRLKSAVEHSREPVLLEIMADKAAKAEIITGLLSLAGEVGMKGAVWVTRPPPAPQMGPNR